MSHLRQGREAERRQRWQDEMQIKGSVLVVLCKQLSGKTRVQHIHMLWRSLCTEAICEETEESNLFELYHLWCNCLIASGIYMSK